MIISIDGWIAGSVSGGYLEGDLAQRAWPLTAERPALVDCGVVDILLERHDPVLDPITLADSWMQAQQRGAIATRISDGELVRAALADDGTPYGDPMFELSRELASAIATGESRIHTHRGHDYLVEAIRPAPRLFVLGTGHDAVPIVASARRLGWDVIVCAHHSDHRICDRFADADAIAIGAPEELALQIDASDRALALAMSHDLDADRANLGMLLGTRAMYIGVLGPRARTDRLLGELGLHARDPRIHAPAGLELGAETPDEIALAIVAEMQAVLARSPATHLREHIGSIHASG